METVNMMDTTNYLFRDIPADLWKKVKVKAAQDDKPIRTVLLDFLQAFTAEKGGKK